MSTAAPTVCVVEDDELLSRTIAELAVDCGLQVLAVAATLGAGRVALRSGQPDVAIIDNGLPDGQGLILCEELGELSPGTTAILYTGLLSPEEECRAERCGVAAVVLKSIRLGSLREALTSVALGDR